MSFCATDGFPTSPGVSVASGVSPPSDVISRTRRSASLRTEPVARPWRVQLLPDLRSATRAEIPPEAHAPPISPISRRAREAAEKRSSRHGAKMQGRERQEAQGKKLHGLQSMSPNDLQEAPEDFSLRAETRGTLLAPPLLRVGQGWLWACASLREFHCLSQSSLGRAGAHLSGRTRGARPKHTTRGGRAGTAGAAFGDCQRWPRFCLACSTRNWYILPKYLPRPREWRQAKGEVGTESSKTDRRQNDGNADH